ncbi:MAG: lamin tail domain-containing protein [Anaerolineales bacterium]|nr:lamin tail domain-containing protein [Anaerolineales bacterium]
MRPLKSLALPLFLFLILLLAWITVSASPPSPLPLFTFSPPTAAPAHPVYLPLLANPFYPPTQDHLLITEVMANPSTGQVEWVELFNRTTAPIDLSGYKIGDEETIGGNEAMRQFPPGAVIQPDQVIVLAMDANVFQATYGFLPDYEIVNTGSPVPDLFDYFPWANGPFSLANTGDELLLLDFFDNPVDSVAWGDSTWAEFTPPAVNPAQGSTLERFPAYLDTDTASDWRAQPNPDPGQVNLAPPPPTPTPTPTLGPTPTPFGGGLLISEVLYDPTGPEPNAEWVEIHNHTGEPLALANFKIGDEEAAGESEGMYQFPPSTLAPGGVAVIANRASEFQIAYGFSPTFELNDTDPDVPDMIKYTAWSGGSMSLTNTGDDVLLLDYYDTVVDAVSWGSSTFAFDPSVPLVPEGTSLERRPPFADTDTAADWQPQSIPNPGTVDLSTPTPTPTPFGSGLYLSEVVYDPSGTEPNNEWFEIYNATGGSLSLTGFKVGDEETQGDSEGMYQFPAGSEMPAGSAFIIANRAAEFQTVHGFPPDFELVDTDPTVPDMTKYTAWSSGSISLVNTGDELLILDSNDNLVDAVSWGSSTWAFSPSVPLVAQDHSLERVPADVDTDTADDWQDQPNPDPGAVNLTPPTPTPTPTYTPTSTNTPTPTLTPTPFTGLLLISEVLYDHVGTEPTGEWIEIYNATSSPVDLTNFKIGDEETQGGGEGMYRFPDGTTLLSDETFVIANQATVFFAAYGFNPDFELNETDPTVPNLTPYTPWATGSINLANAGDEVLLLDPGNNVVDAVSWGTSTWAFNPSVPGVSEGHSIERVPADVDTDTNTDWVDQPTPDPGNVNLGG